MEQFIKDQIIYGLRYLPTNLVKSYFIKDSSAETEKMRKNFICGVCHPTDNYQQITEGNIEWIRIDIPFPYEKDGTLRGSYTAFKNKCLGFQSRGIKVMAVTPYPRDYIRYGIDLNTPEGEKAVREIAEFIVTDMQGVVSGLQITNEMGIPHFTLPLTMKEAVRFIGIQLEAMYPHRKDIIIGYNSAAVQADLHTQMKPYHRYCDYVGVDIYIGCFLNLGGIMWMFDAVLRYLWALTGKPIILQEFGYISGGAPKTPEEKKAVLQKYGVSSEAQARADIESFVEKLPETYRNHVKKVGVNNPERYFNLIFHSDLVNHLYCELPKTTVIPGYPHTPEGQGKFYKDILERLYKLKFLCGTIVYCYSDSERCYICGQSDCPTESRWGLVDRQGNPKPSYYAVQEAFGKIRGIK